MRYSASSDARVTQIIRTLEQRSVLDFPDQDLTSAQLGTDCLGPPIKVA
jgi:hypothetical protein